MYADGNTLAEVQSVGEFSWSKILAPAVYYSPLAIGLRLFQGGTIYDPAPDDNSAGSDLPGLIRNDTLAPRPTFASTLGREIGTGVKWGIVLAVAGALGYLYLSRPPRAR